MLGYYGLMEQPSEKIALRISRSFLLNNAMKYIIVFLLSLIGGRISAQQCDIETLLKKPGIWKEGMKGSMSGIVASDLAREKKVVAQIHSMMQAHYSPVAVEILYNGVYNPSFSWMSAIQYSYSIIPLRMYCQSGKIVTEHESSGHFYIGANIFDAEIYSVYTEENEPGYGFHYMSDLPELKNGVYYFKQKNVRLAFDLPGVAAGWLITIDDKLPYSYVTRKEFLDKRKSILQRQEKANIKNFDETVVSKNKEKALYEVEYKNDPVKWQRYLKMDYQSVLDVNEKNRIKFANNYKAAYAKLEEQMRKPAEELNQIAIVKDDPQDYLNYLFTTDEDGFGKILIKPNPSYFNPKLPRSIPHFFFIHQVGPYDNEVAKKIFDGMIAAIDMQALKNMLGKEPASLTSSKNTPVSLGPKTIKPKTLVVDYDVYKREATPGFKPSTAASTASVIPTLPVVDAAIKAKAMTLQLTAASMPGYLSNVQSIIDNRLTDQQKKNTKLLFDKLKANPVELADVGVLLYYKGAITEALWCLTKAASLQPANDYVLSNLTGIMNMSQAEAAALPVLRYLNKKVPNNTTILNNLGQALYALGEQKNSKAVLDSCIRIFAYHPQANMTRAVIAKKEGKSAEATVFIQKSIWVAYSEMTDDFADKNGIKLDYANLLNRFHPTNTEYINANSYRPPPQCENVAMAEELEAKWDAWTAKSQQVTAKVSAGLEAANANYQRQVQQQLANKTSTASFSLGPMHAKGQKMYHIYMDKLTEVQRSAQEYFDNKYKKDKEYLEKEHADALKKIEETIGKQAGEGKGAIGEAYCNAINAAHNVYLMGIAGLNYGFQGKFSETIRSLNSELMYWSQFLAGPSAYREMIYYERALFAVNPMLMHSIFIKPCQTNNKAKGSFEAPEIPYPYCPISFRLKVAFVKVAGDCSKFDLEVEAEGVVLNIERDFIKKKSTIALGAGMSLDLHNKVGDVSKNVLVPSFVASGVDAGGGGVGAKGQFFIEMDGTGVTDLGLRAEAGVEGVLTDKGDVKISGKIGINSGVDVSATPGAIAIGQAINGVVK